MLRTICAALAVTLLTGPSWAQTATGQPGLGGAAVRGLCFLSRQDLLTNAKIGQAATVRLQGFHRQAQAAVDAERAPLAVEAAEIQKGRAKLDPTVLRRKQEDLARRLSVLEADAQARTRQIEVTREKAVGVIAEHAKPLIAQAYAAHGCGLLVDREVVLGGNLSGDLTAEIVRGLDARVTTITFDLAPLPEQAPKP